MIGYKNFTMIPNMDNEFSLKIEPYDEESEFKCLARSRLTGGTTEWPVVDAGSNAGYITIRAPKQPLDSRGFLYQIQQRSPNSEEWVVVASGKIEEKSSMFSQAVST